MPQSARVLCRRVSDLRSAVEEALDFLGYEFADRRVWVKPNLLSPRPPEDSVTTDPELVRCVVEGLRRRGVGEAWVADNPGGALKGRVADFVARTGVPAAVGESFRDISATPVPVSLDSRFVSEVHFSRIITEVDVILNLPVFKTHALTLLTGAVKNLFGIIPGGQKGHLHTLAPDPVDFSELLIDIYRAVPVPVLTIVDALRGMDGQNGPSAGRVLAIGKLITGAHPVAVDSVLARMAGVAPERIPMLRIAAERGLGPVSPEEVEVLGDFERIRGFRLPSQRLHRVMSGMIRGVYSLMRRWPALRHTRCIRCRRCADNCPAQAIVMTPLPTIDRSKCIRCYCCVEICPVQALRVPGFWGGVGQNLLPRRPGRTPA
uniref:DUF362 domain-containing protein n=1 Tax=candidate division WOR-3 bacterium TaxID=2052148 RepID=A0A7C4GD17_UNCW3